MEQCRGGCSHEMVKSPATAATMAYPTEEEKRSYRRIGGTNGDDDDDDNDDDDDDVVRSNGNREARNRDLVMCRVCDFKNDRDDDLESYLNDYNNGSRNGATDTSNSDFTCSCQPQLTPEAADRLSEPSSSQDFESRPGGKENRRLSERRSRKQSRPRQVVWHRDHRKRYLIPALGLGQNVRNQKFKIKDKSVQCHQRLARQRTFKCHLCPKYAPARGKTHRPYHSKASLTLHMLWRHKRRSWLPKNYISIDNVGSTVSSVTLKATFFTNPNYRYDR